MLDNIASAEQLVHDTEEIQESGAEFNAIAAKLKRTVALQHVCIAGYRTDLVLISRLLLLTNVFCF